MSNISLPLGIDIHVHFRTPGSQEKETLETGYNAALLGGIGTVMDMPNTNPPIDNVIEFDKKARLLEKYRYIHQIAAITDNNIANGELLHLTTRTKFFKLFMANSTGDLGISLNNLENAFSILVEEKPFVFIHAELPEYLSPRTSESRESEIRPEIAEIKAVEKIIALAEDYSEINFHLTHISTFDSAELILENAIGNITWDCLPKFLKFDDSLVNERGNYAKMNPPLRTKSTKEKLYQLFTEGKIPILASDHAPHTHQDKVKPVAGAPSVQELYLFLIDEYLRDNIDKKTMIDMIYSNPKNILDRYGYEIREGTISVDTNETFKLTSEKILSKCGWSLWENYEFQGKITSING